MGPTLIRVATCGRRGAAVGVGGGRIEGGWIAIAKAEGGREMKNETNMRKKTLSDSGSVTPRSFPVSWSRTIPPLQLPAPADVGWNPASSPEEKVSLDQGPA